jgi:gliding motility-associated lipoprotein GldD
MERMKKSLYLIILIAGLMAASCSQPAPVPKPVGYPRINFPQHTYQTYTGNCPYTFRYPQYAQIVPDTAKGSEPCWFNVYFPQFNARFHMSYKKVVSPANFHDLTEDARTFAYKHTVKAEDIYDSLFHISDNHVSGITYEIAGNTASSLQFFATDSSSHFLRGALYFYSHPNKDSIAPMVNFIRTDMDTMLRSLQWK